MSHIMNVLNALYMEGLSTTHREELFSEARGAIHLDFSKIIELPVGITDMYTTTELRRTYWGTTQYPVTRDLVTVNLVTFATHDGHGLPVIRKISEMYSDKTIYHAYFYTDIHKGYIVQWRNGEIHGLEPVDPDTDTARQLADMIRNKLSSPTDTQIDTYYHKYDMVQIKCCVQAYSDLADTNDGVRSRELFRTGDVGIVTHVNHNANGDPISYTVHDTVTGQTATLLPSEMAPINFGSTIDSKRIAVRQSTPNNVAEEEGD